MGKSKIDRMEVKMDIFSNEIQVECVASCNQSQILMLVSAADAVARNLDTSVFNVLMQALCVHKFMEDFKTGDILVDLGG